MTDIANILAKLSPEEQAALKAQILGTVSREEAINIANTRQSQDNERSAKIAERVKGMVEKLGLKSVDFPTGTKKVTLMVTIEATESGFRHDVSHVGEGQAPRKRVASADLTAQTAEGGVRTLAQKATVSELGLKTGDVIERDHKGSTYRLTITDGNSGQCALNGKLFGSLSGAGKFVTQQQSCRGSEFWLGSKTSKVLRNGQTLKTRLDDGGFWRVAAPTEAPTPEAATEGDATDAK